MKNKNFLSIFLLSLIFTLILAACSTNKGIHGSIIGDDNKPLVNIKVLLNKGGTSDPSSAQMIYTDQKGSFKFLNNPSGDYVLTVLMDSNPSCPSLEALPPFTMVSDFLVNYSKKTEGNVFVAVKEFNYDDGKDQSFKLNFPCTSSLSNQTKAVEGLDEGVKVSDLTFLTYDDQSYSLADFKGKVLIVNFWSSWAVPCAEVVQLLEQISQKYSPDDVIILGVNYQDSQKDAQDFIAKNGITYPNGPDDDETLYKQFGVTGVPQTFVIDQSGELVKNLAGTNNMSFESLSDIIDKMVK